MIISTPLRSHSFWGVLRVVAMFFQFEAIICLNGYLDFGIFQRVCFHCHEPTLCHTGRVIFHCTHQSLATPTLTHSISQHTCCHSSLIDSATCSLLLATLLLYLNPRSPMAQCQIVCNPKLSCLLAITNLTPVFDLDLISVSSSGQTCVCSLKPSYPWELPPTSACCLLIPLTSALSLRHSSSRPACDELIQPTAPALHSHTPSSPFPKFSINSGSKRNLVSSSVLVLHWHPLFESVSLTSSKSGNIDEIVLKPNSSRL